MVHRHVVVGLVIRATESCACGAIKWTLEALKTTQRAPVVTSLCDYMSTVTELHASNAFTQSASHWRYHPYSLSWPANPGVRTRPNASVWNIKKGCDFFTGDGGRRRMRTASMDSDPREASNPPRPLMILPCLPVRTRNLKKKTNQISKLKTSCYCKDFVGAIFANRRGYSFPAPSLTLFTFPGSKPTLDAVLSPLLLPKSGSIYPLPLKSHHHLTPSNVT